MIFISAIGDMRVMSDMSAIGDMSVMSDMSDITINHI